MRTYRGSESFIMCLGCMNLRDRTYFVLPDRTLSRVCDRCRKGKR